MGDDGDSDDEGDGLPDIDDAGAMPGLEDDKSENVD